MQNRVSIAVVIPLYNKERSIVKTLNSVLCQSCLPHEIIVVDDGSTDASVECVLSLRSNLVRLIQKSNGGVSSARNVGFKNSNSDFIAFLDADDLWLPHHLQTIISSIYQYPTAAMFTTMHLVRRCNVDYRNKWIFCENSVSVLDCFFSSYAKSLSLISSSNVCISKDALIKTGGFPQGVSRGEDVIAWIKIGMLYKVCHADVITAIYNQDADNRSEYKPIREIPGSILYINALINKRDRQDLKKPLLRLYNSIAVSTAAGLVLHSHYYQAFSLLVYSFRNGMYLCALKIAVIFIVPSYVLNILKRLRRFACTNVEND